MPSPDTIAQWVVAVLGGGGAVKFVVDIINTRSKGRKEGAEGSAILVSSASGYAQQLTERVNELGAEVDRMRREQAHRDRRQDALFQAHGRWDAQVHDKLLALGEIVPPPPPLYVE